MEIPVEKNNRVCNILGIKYPLIQAAMNWITDAKMVAAVSNAGGMGVLGPNAGAKVIDGRTISTEERYANEFRKIKSLTDKPFAVNVILEKDGATATEEYARKVIDTAFSEGVKYFLTVGNVNKKIFKYIKAHNGIIIHREMTISPQTAKLAEAEGADIIIATGYDEGGWIPQSGIGTFTIVPAIVDAVQIPVMASGGITDLRGVRASFALGADGVYVGTRFIAATECPAADAAKKDLLAAKAEDLIFVSPMQRSTPHKFARDLAKLYENGMSNEELQKRIAAVDDLRPAMLEGKLEDGIVSIDTGINLINEIKSCADIVKELMADFM